MENLKPEPRQDREHFEWKLRPTNIHTDIEVIPQAARVYKAPHCARCDSPIQLADHQKDTVTAGGNWQHLQAPGALIIRFEGSYGMAVDPIDGNEFRWILCEDCAHKFLDDNPWLRR